MTRFQKVAICAPLVIALAFSTQALAFQKGGGTNGGGGTTGGGGTGGGGNGGGGNGGGGGGGGSTAPSIPLTFLGGLVTFPVPADNPAFMLLRATSDGRDAPTITEVSGPAGLVLDSMAPADHPHGSNGSNIIQYIWNPSRADIGTTPTAVFTATTQSGAHQTLTVNLGPVQDGAPGQVSDVTAMLTGDHIEARWSQSPDGTPLTYIVSACYHSLLADTSLPFVYCDTVRTTSDLQLLDIPSGPTTNTGQPGVPATYYGIFVFATSAIDSHFEGEAAANVQTAQ